MNDPNILEPGHLPTPFTAAQIRAACPPGREITLSVWEGDTSVMRVVRFVEADADGAVQTSQTFTPDGKPTGEPSMSRNRWEEYQRHASFPATSTTRRVEDLASSFGLLRCRVYEVKAGSEATSFWFALDRPGMPVRVETRRDGRIISTMEMVGDSVS